MTIQPRDVLKAFKPMLVPRRLTTADDYWAGVMDEVRQAVSKAQNAAMRTAFDSPSRCAELSSFLKDSDSELLTMRIATVGAPSSMIFDELHRDDPNYTP